MTKIKLYPNDTNISGDDKWIGSDGDNNEITKNFTVDDVGAYINALGVESVSTSDGSFIDLTPLGAHPWTTTQPMTWAHLSNL